MIERIKQLKLERDALWKEGAILREKLEACEWEAKQVNFLVLRLEKEAGLR